MKLKQITPYCYEIPRTGAMRVPGRVFMSPRMAGQMVEEEALKQVANVATLPGILTAAMAMPDMHWGYGFPIGGVAAFDWDEGVISPGGVGYDINCGVRLAATGLEEKDIRPKIDLLVEGLFANIPSGVGSTGSVKLSTKESLRVLREGGRWAVRQGMGEPSDVARTEDGGCMDAADPSVVSPRALERGSKQLGTLGSGNHFLEVGVVDEIFDAAAASAFGLFENQITVLLHSGSRGLGYQICDDFLAFMNKHVKTLGIQLPDRQLSCAMIRSDAGQRYFRAMACAANYAWANRQILLHRARETFQQVLGIGPRELAMHQVYDICHNIAKRETHLVDGQPRVVCVHRKGATRAFAPGHPAIPEAYRQVGQPILIPGDMGTASYVLVGTQKAMTESFGSTCHGAGRVLSRTAARNGVAVGPSTASWPTRALSSNGPAAAPWPRRCPTPTRISTRSWKACTGRAFRKRWRGCDPSV